MNPIESVPRSAVDAASFATVVKSHAVVDFLYSVAVAVGINAIAFAIAFGVVRADSHADELEPKGGSSCPGAVVDYTFQGYDGPVGITGACLARFQYTGGRMTVAAYDVTSDGLFRNGFELPPEE